MAQKEMKQKQKSRKNVKKKFFDVEVPLTSTKVSLYAGSVDELNGQVVKIDLTRSLRGKSLELKYKIKAEDEKLSGEIVCARLVQSYVRRVTRRGTDYVEDSFIMNCRDRKLVVKPLLITRKRVSRNVRGALRELTKKYLQSHFKTKKAEEIFKELLSNKVQKNLSLKLKKIYPLSMSEIRICEILGEVDKDLEDKEESEIMAEEESSDEVEAPEVKKKTKKKVEKKE